MPAVEVHNLHKEFGRKVAPRRAVSARARSTASASRSRAGKCISILGRNGSGKSTLVRVLSTLILPDSGEARIFGHDVVDGRGRAPARQPCVGRGLLLQEDVGGREPVLRGAVLRGRHPRDADAHPGDPRPRGLPALAPRLTHGAVVPGYAAEGGAGARTAHLAGAAAPRRTDDGLDPRSKLEVQAFIEDIREEHDTTILLCTHDMREAEVLSERIGILEHGRCSTCAGRELLAQFQAETIEEVFLASTGGRSRTTTRSNRWR